MFRKEWLLCLILTRGPGLIMMRFVGKPILLSTNNSDAKFICLKITRNRKNLHWNHVIQTNSYWIFGGCGLHIFRVIFCETIFFCIWKIFENKGKGFFKLGSFHVIALRNVWNTFNDISKERLYSICFIKAEHCSKIDTVTQILGM